MPEAANASKEPSKKCIPRTFRTLQGNKPRSMRPSPRCAKAFASSQECSIQYDERDRKAEDLGHFSFAKHLDDAPVQGPYSADKRGVMSYSSSSWLRYRCKECGCEVGFRSISRNIGERYLLPIFFRQPVRCSKCYRRDSRLIFVHVEEPRSESGMLR